MKSKQCCVRPSHIIRLAFFLALLQPLSESPLYFMPLFFQYIFDSTCTPVWPLSCHQMQSKLYLYVGNVLKCLKHAKSFSSSLSGKPFRVLKIIKKSNHDLFGHSVQNHCHPSLVAPELPRKWKYLSLSFCDQIQCHLLQR